MKVKIVFDLDDRDRRAIALSFKRKAPATRAEVAQFVTELVTTYKLVLLRELRRRELNPDPNQQKFPGMGEEEEARGNGATGQQGKRQET